MPAAEVSQSPLARPLETCHTNSMIKGNEMQVYMVYGGWDETDTDGGSIKLFDCKSTAEEYKKYLEDFEYDYIKMDIMPVIMESALAR